MPTENNPIIKRFELIGLHGYKNISLDIQSATSIVIAENGTGKTTFLSALESFLTRNFAKLASLSFERIECEFAGQSNPLILYRNHIRAITDEVQSGLQEFVHYAKANVTDVREAIVNQEGDHLHQSSILHRVYIESPWSLEETLDRIRKLRVELEQEMSDEVKDVNLAVKAALGKTAILYLPTYRRVELARSKRDSRRSVDRWMRLRPSAMIDDSSIEAQSTLGINYGLADVEATLRRLTETIQQRTNNGYREISASIIDDLIAGRFAAGDWQNEPLPEIESLRLFFSRIEQPSSESQQRLNSISHLYDHGNLEQPNNQPLRYYLVKLSKVINRTRELEAGIESFVKICNEYLSSSSDEKVLRYNAKERTVKVINTWTDSNIRFDDLSSGEKQVISLFAHLYLSRRQKIIMIDEPELSLSIEWQKRLLPDVVRSPACRQLLAITHSPFVFENELDPYATPLNVKRNKKKGSSTKE